MLGDLDDWRSRAALCEAIDDARITRTDHTASGARGKVSYYQSVAWVMYKQTVSIFDPPWRMPRSIML